MYEVQDLGLFLKCSLPKAKCSINCDICFCHNCLQGNLIIQEYMLIKEKASQKYGPLVLEM